jgi:hypothetical protein
MKMHLSHRLRDLCGWAYDRGSHGLPAMWIEAPRWKKPSSACSFDGRHNRFSSLKIAETAVTSKGYVGSGVGTGDLWGSDDTAPVSRPRAQGVGTGDLWGSDDRMLKLTVNSLGVGTGDLWGSDDMSCALIRAVKGFRHWRSVGLSQILR